jgi:hypothetical protein
MRRSARSAFLAWAGLCVLIGASLGAIYLRLGPEGYAVFIQQPPLINLPVTLASTGLLWLSAGLLLYLLQAGKLNSANLFTWAGFFAVTWTYLNFLSERWRYGDYSYYWDAARSLFANLPLPGSYFYPPLWATLLQYLVPAGEDTFFIVLWLLDMVSFVAFYFLLQRVLERYGFSTRLAAVVTAGFMLANAPLLRTLAYVQVNLHTLDLILLAILLFPDRMVLSAIALALAIHLKGSPAILVLAFLPTRNWRWFGWLAAALIAIAGITVVTDGIGPFFDVLQHWQGLAFSDNTIFHDTSFDSFLRFTALLLHADIVWTRVLSAIAKVALAAAALWVMLAGVRSKAFIAKGAGVALLNGIPPLFIAMTLLAPVVWEHHAVFVALSFLLMLKRLETPHEWLWFGFAYLLEFLLPTFDFYPWSFGRLIAPLIILWQMWRLGERPGDAPVFTSTNRWFARLSFLGRARGG